MVLSRFGISTVFGELQELSPTRGQTVVEATPLFKSPEGFPLWRQYTTSVYVALLALVALLPELVRRATAPQ